MPSSESSLPRSPEQLTRQDSALLVVDVQGKLTALMANPAQMLFNVERLVDAAAILQVATLATEQYPEKLGPTHPQIGEKLAAPAAKRAFSCGECGDLFTGLSQQGIHKVVVCGMETHVCVLQTTLDLLASGFSVHLVVDALSARGAIDHDTALRRMESSGATLTTVETVLFEWCETSTIAEFKSISGLVRKQLDPREV